MGWLSFAVATIFFYSLFDLFLKLSSDKIHSGTGAFIMNAFATLVLLVFTLYSYFNGEKIMDIRSGGFLYSSIAGIAVGLASIFFIKMFATGVNLSVGVPLVRVGMVILAGILGILFLKEGFNVKYLIGLFLSLVGLFLVVSSK